MPTSDRSKPYAQEGYDLMAAAFEVHNEVGGGLAEEVYQQSLEIELGLRGISFVSKQALSVFYKNRQLQTFFKPDLMVSGVLVVELKTVSQLLPEHEGQLFNYLRILKRPVGYLINFGPMAKLEWQRYVLSEYLDEERTADVR